MLGDRRGREGRGCSAGRWEGRGGGGVLGDGRGGVTILHHTHIHGTQILERSSSVLQDFSEAHRAAHIAKFGCPPGQV